ncbi:prepilin-type N-terminal cleavage/methylation domain-containing protein [Vibrio parahaemolyticus]|nr:prepilin-type N-terminal cleavage/methylation domain-containing protein [Vibrio parahaemolyticus]EJR2787908.1 prepilin-type N-terminal cleavage/methylation domain-containing protein [Vibrio parahaemolyticus]
MINHGYKNKKRGVTLIETMIAVSVMGTLGAGVINMQMEKNANENAERYGSELAKTLKAFDNRLYIDGYDADVWTKKNWNLSNFNSDFLAKQLNASGSKCGTTEWNPTNAVDTSFKTMPCDGLWKRMPYGLIPNASISEDSGRNIDQFNLVLSFKNDDHFEEEFTNVRKMLRSANRSTNDGVAGIHEYSFIDKTSLGEITTTECINAKSNCALQASFNRAGGTEYLRADGQNSVIGSNISFIESKGQAPMKCARWVKSSSGTWSLKDKTDSSPEECGIGIYKKTGEPLLAEVLADTGTFQTVALNKSCSKMEFNASTGLFEASADKVPCGLMNDGSEAVMVLDNIHANQVFLNEIKANDAELATLNVSNHSEFNTLNVNGEFKALAKAILNEVEATKITTVDFRSTGLAKLEGGAEIGTASNPADLTVYGDTSLNGLLTVSGKATFEDSIIADKDIKALSLTASVANVDTLNAKVANIETGNFSGNVNVDGKLTASEISTSKLYAANATLPTYDKKLVDLEGKLKAYVDGKTTSTPTEPPTNQGWKTVYSGNGARSILIADRTWSNYRVHVKYKGEGRAWVNEDKNLTDTKVGLVSQNSTVSYNFKGQACNTFSVTAIQTIYADSSRVSVPSTDKTAKTVVGGNYGGCPEMTAYATLKDLYITKLELYY